MKSKFILWLFIIWYILYFSYYSILRYKTLNASYYDLGIMHQTVYNSYRSIQTGDWSRFLELTNPTGTNQIKRMAIHNDLMLGFLSIFYFLSATPTTLIVIQSVVLALGAWYVHGIAQRVFKKQRFKDVLSLLFSFCYLMYVPMQRSNMFDFHAVVLATTFILGFFYYWICGRKVWSLFFLVTALLTKEQIGFTTALTGIYMFIVEFIQYRSQGVKSKNSLIRSCWYPIVVVALSLGWSILSFTVIIPYFRGSEHFAAQRYEQFGDSTGTIVKTLLLNPKRVFLHLVSVDALSYLRDLLAALSFISLLSPIHLLLAIPEFAINLLSNNGNTRNIFFHYTAVLQPYIFLSSIYGLNLILIYLKKALQKKNTLLTYLTFLFGIVILVSTVWFSINRSPLWYSKEKESFPSPIEKNEILLATRWSHKLKSDLLKVSTTGHLAPYFTGRRFFYDLSIDGYKKADYVVLSKKEVADSLDAARYSKAYNALRRDTTFSKIEDDGDTEVYRKLTNSN